MHKCLIVGKPNVGKTAFLLSFSRYLGLAQVELRVRTSDGSIHAKRRSIDCAYTELVGPVPHITQELQSVVLELPVGKGRRSFELVDSSGIMDGIHASPVVRAAMAQTLEAVTAAKVIIHILDAAAIGLLGLSEGVGVIDRDLAEYAQQQGEYFLLANKMDLAGAQRGLQIITKAFTQVQTFPVSALTMEGFKEVKRHVARVI